MSVILDLVRYKAAEYIKREKLEVDCDVVLNVARQILKRVDDFLQRAKVYLQQRVKGLEPKVDDKKFLQLANDLKAKVDEPEYSAFFAFRPEAAVALAIMVTQDQFIDITFPEVFSELLGDEAKRNIDKKTQCAVQRIFLEYTNYWFPLRIKVIV